jgi:DinB family protein
MTSEVQPMDSVDLRYPTGRFVFDGSVTPEARRRRIDTIAGTPAAMRSAVERLTSAHLDTPYRPGGWTVRQVVHHVPDSHMNAYTRFKLALTEETPTIRPYDEARWAELADSKMSIEPSLQLLVVLHERWVALLRSLTPADFDREIFHPERNARMTLDEILALYAWHGPHHVAHIVRLREREGWR